MSVIRVAKRTKFTTVARTSVNDARLSFRARGVLVWLLDKPDDWKTTADAIAANGTEGRDAVRRALNELEGCGYLARKRWKNEAGVWQSEWIVREVPNSPERETSAGQLQRKTRPLITKTETETDLAESSSQLVDKANPTCITCRGKGTYYDGMAGFDKTCRCTFVKDESG